MKPIVVRDQVRLGLGKSLSLTIAGMYYRLTRSTITMSIVALAVAFLCYMFTYGILVQERTNAAYIELEKTRVLAGWTNRLTIHDPVPRIITALARKDSNRVNEYRKWVSVNESYFLAYHDQAKKMDEFVSYINSLREQARVVLLGESDPYTLPSVLSNSTSIDRFIKQVAELNCPLPFDNEQAFRTFLSNDFPSIKAFVDSVQYAQSRVITTVHKKLKKTSLIDALLDNPDRFGKEVIKSGYSLSVLSIDTLVKQATFEKNQKFVITSLLVPEIRSAVARSIDIDQKLLDIGNVTKWMCNSKNTGFFHSLSITYVKNDVPGVPELYEMAINFQRVSLLERIVGDELPTTKVGFASLPQNTRWLILVSFLVCAVGVCNTMFMSVTERFTEIATMKCLGAMDSFIMIMFVLESIIQGMTGSIIGLFLGIFLAFFRGTLGYGTMIFEALPWGAIVYVTSFSFFVGVILSAVAAVGPAWMASRLAPMEAMRVE